MMSSVFESIFDKDGNYGLQSKQCISYTGEGIPKRKRVLLAWRSPHATAEQNAWLEVKLHKLYKRYYIKVIVQSLGYFW